ncbi:MAG: hypothetical protein ACLQPH_16485 [Acidimicrobiales bacterium]
MSDTSQGPGWWLASDGRWYPPEQAPAPTSAPSPAGADSPQGPGWWRATDGRWYPPQPGVPWAVPPKKKFYARVWFWLLIVLALGIGGCVTVVGVASVAVSRVAKEKHTIVYSVTGTGQAAAIVYNTLQEGNGQNGEVHVTDPALPWSTSITASGLITLFDVTATVGPAGGAVTCNITEDSRLVSSNSAHGAGASAECTWGG